MTELDPRQRELASALRETLDRAAERPDPLLEAALAATRAQIAARKPSAVRRHPWLLAGGFAVAACLAVVLVLPGIPGGPATSSMPATVAETAAMPDADLQMLEDMDVLVAMGEGRHEG